MSKLVKTSLFTFQNSSGNRFKFFLLHITVFKLFFNSMAQHTALTAKYLFQHFFSFLFDDLFRSINLHFSSRTHMEDTGRHQYLIKGLWHKINYEIRNYVIRGRALLSVGGPTGGPTGGCQLEVSWEMLRGFLESRGSVPTGGRWWFIC